MKTVCKKLLCLMLVAMLLVSAAPFALADDAVACEHVYDEGTVTTPATCQQEGVKTFTCTLCTEGTEGHTKTETITKTRCTFGAEQTKAATCGTAGESYQLCTVCGTKRTTGTTPATGVHTYVNGVCACGATAPVEEEPEESNTVNITIYEVEVDADGNMLNAVQYKVVNNVDVDSYANMDAMIKAIYGKQYSDYKYREFGDGSAALNVWYVETKNDNAVYQLKVMFNNGTSDYKMFDIYEGEGILAAIKNAGISPKYEDHVLVGYLKNHTGNAKTYLTIYDVASDAVADENGIIKVYADWREETDDDDEDYEYGEGGGLYGDSNSDPIYDVVLYIYTNGKTSSYAKKVTSSTMGRFTKDGVLTDDEVQLVVENYFKTGSTTKYYGLFNKETWNSGNYLTMNAEYEVKLDPNDTNYVYVMVKNATAYVADSSNPKTGDNIMIAVSTLALSAAALVTVIELKKRKMI